jgi:hypothetical protein
MKEKKRVFFLKHSKRKSKDREKKKRGKVTSDFGRPARPVTGPSEFQKLQKKNSGKI